jgi:large subunit ribosomal protein L22
MLPAGLVGHARLRYLGISAQKARLVVDLIRGKQVEEAIATLRFTHKVVASDIGRALDSALANARVKKPEIDVDRLYVQTAFVDGGPSLKRIRPAPMGRAFRVQKRMCHVTLGLAERPLSRPPVPKRDSATASAAAPAAEGAPAPRARQAKTQASPEKSAAPKGAAPRKKAAKGRGKSPRSGGKASS